MVSRNADRPRMSILLGLGRAGLAVLAGAAFAYMAWNPLPPPPVDRLADEVDAEDASTLEAERVEAEYPDAMIQHDDRALVAPETWALVMPRSGAFDRLSRGLTGPLCDDVATDSDARPSATAEGATRATGLQRPRGPPARAMSRGYRL